MGRIQATMLATGAVLALCGPAAALTSQECSAKYQAAKQDGTLNGLKWNQFRKAECGVEAVAHPTVANPLNPGAASAPSAPAAAPPATPAGKPMAATPAASGTAVFPRAVDPRYAADPAGKGRQATCLDQYKANKATGGNAGLAWIMKGGGYYSECNKRLKG